MTFRYERRARTNDFACQATRYAAAQHPPAPIRRLDLYIAVEEGIRC
jgi:hypothetical protein